MCFSAIVMQRAKKLGIMFQARIQTEDYADLFDRRMQGEKLLLGRGLEADFLENPENKTEERIQKAILQWHQFEAERLQDEIVKQAERKKAAAEKLATKITKKAENDLRVSTQKIEKMTQDLQRHLVLSNLTESDDRIFPKSWASMVCTDDNGNRIIRPVRYLLRPHNKDESFDQKFNGCYNARRDTLQSVPWWKDALGKRHGLILVRKFFEYVARDDYKKNSGEGSIELRFAPEKEEWLLVPTLWDEWKSQDGKIMTSAAIITDEPLPEVLATGHDRTPIFLTDQGAQEWLDLEDSSPAALDSVLEQKHIPHLNHKARETSA